MHELKAGCIAEITCNTRHNGQHVQVIGPAPVGRRFSLPNGKTQAPCCAGCWVVEPIGFRVDCRYVDGSLHSTSHGVAHSESLKPLGPESDFLQSINIDAVMDQITGGNHA